MKADTAKIKDQTIQEEKTELHSTQKENDKNGQQHTIISF